MGKIKESTIYILLFILSIFTFIYGNKGLASIILLLIFIMLCFNYRYIFKILKANKLYASAEYDKSLNLYRQCVLIKTIPGFVINNYLIMELKYGSSKIAEDYINNNLPDLSKFNSADSLSIKVSEALIAWKNHNTDKAIEILENLLEENENTYLYETLTSLLIVNNYLDKALEVTNKALEYTDSSNVLKSNYYEIQYLLGHYTEAEEGFSSLIDENITFMEPYYYKAAILITKDKKEEAKILLEKALTFNDSLVSSINKEKILTLLNTMK